MQLARLRYNHVLKNRPVFKRWVSLMKCYQPKLKLSMVCHIIVRDV